MLTLLVMAQIVVQVLRLVGLIALLAWERTMFEIERQWLLFSRRLFPPTKRR